jgi:hypothetical protein
MSIALFAERVSGSVCVTAIQLSGKFANRIILNKIDQAMRSLINALPKI